MVYQQVRSWDVLDPRVLGVLAAVPRELFVPEGYRGLAFADTQIPLAHGQFMMRPTIEGRMLQALELSLEDQVLEIGTGSGFITACLATLAREVTSIDIFGDFVAAARDRLGRQRIRNVQLDTADVWQFDPGTQFDAIAVTGSMPLHDARLESWLKPGGRMFVVAGQAPVMDALLVNREGSRDCARTSLFETVLPPLLNAPRPEPFVF